MKVKWIINNDQTLTVEFVDKTFSVDYKSDDIDAFKKINIQLLENIAQDISMEVEYFEDISVQYKVGKAIIDTYLAELNRIKKELGHKEATINYNLIKQS